MKTVFGILLALGLLSPSAQAGFDSGNNGDVYVNEFLYSGRDVLQRLELLAAEGKPLMATAELRRAMEKAKISSKDRVYDETDGKEVDARNWPATGELHVSRTRWEKYRAVTETNARLKLALHEFMWLAKIDDTDFAKSGPIIAKLKVPPYSPSIWQHIPGTAFAVAECAGQLRDGTFVTVKVNTRGATKSPDHGEVSIERTGNKFGYRFGAGEISQFFESDDEKANTAVVGLSAFIAAEYAVSVSYSGANYVDMDLKAVLESGVSAAAGKGSMRVWMGPGYKATETYVLENAVCSVSSNN